LGSAVLGEEDEDGDAIDDDDDDDDEENSTIRKPRKHASPISAQPKKATIS